jgi:hypothetical protein
LDLLENHNSNPLDDHRDALSAADARRRQSVTTVAAV